MPFTAWRCSLCVFCSSLFFFNWWTCSNTLASLRSGAGISCPIHRLTHSPCWEYWLRLSSHLFSLTDAYTTFLTLSALVHSFLIWWGDCLMNQPEKWCWYFLLSSTSKDICCGCARLACKDKLVLITVQLYGIACYTDWIWSYRTGASYHTFYSSEYFLVWAYLWKSISEYIHMFIFIIYLYLNHYCPATKDTGN